MSMLREVAEVDSVSSASVVDDDDGDEAWKVVMLVALNSRAAFIEEVLVSNSIISSLACISSSLTQESCTGEYPFHLTRYCFFFHLPKVHSFINLSTSHSGSSSIMSGGGWRKFGPCSGVSQ